MIGQKRFLNQSEVLFLTNKVHVTFVTGYGEKNQTTLNWYDFVIHSFSDYFLKTDVSQTCKSFCKSVSFCVISFLFFTSDAVQQLAFFLTYPSPKNIPSKPVVDKTSKRAKKTT